MFFVPAFAYLDTASPWCVCLCARSSFVLFVGGDGDNRKKIWREIFTGGRSHHGRRKDVISVVYPSFDVKR